MTPFLRTLLVWSALIPLAIANGIVRESVLAPRLGPAALPLSGLILSLLILLTAIACAPFLRLRTRSAAVRAGLIWMCLTLCFEFSFGLLAGKSMTELLTAFDPTTGNLWSVVMITIGLAPFLAATMRKTFR